MEVVGKSFSKYFEKMFAVLLLLQPTFAIQNSTIYHEYRHGESTTNLKYAVERIVEEITEKSDCLVFITDTVYHGLIDMAHINKSDYASRYTIDIRDNEQFSPARKQIRKVLELSKAASCNAYIILIANGLLTSHFLKYVEGDRLINTGGYFLMLYDQRLFQRELRYIWNRIVNVIFLRRYSSFKRRSGETVFQEPINLYTTYFPSYKKVSVGSRYIDTWYRNKFRYGADHYMEKTKNLRGRPLRVAIFEHLPAVTKDSRDYYENGPKYADKPLGAEFEIMRTVSEMMNFNPVYYMPYDIEVERWGKLGENQSYTGLLGEAINGKAAFFLGDLHYTLRHLIFFDLSISYNTECLTFLTPESLTDNSWKLLILPFRLNTWIAVLFTLVIGGGAMYLFSLSYKKHISFYKDTARQSTENIEAGQPKKIEGMRGLYLFTEPQNSIMYMYSMLLLVSLPRLPDPWAVRVFIGCWWMYSLLLAVSYRASMTATLANPVARVTIDSLAQLAKSPVAVGGWSEESKDFFLTSSDPTSQFIGNKFEVIENEDDAVSRVANGTFCYYENSDLLNNARVKRQVWQREQEENNTEEYKNSGAKHNLHIMEECVVNMPVALGLEKNSPLKPHVDKLVRRILEVGLINKWLSDVMEWSKITEIRQAAESEQAIVNLKKLYGALVAIGIGYFISFIILIGEILHWKYVVLKNPRYDKYYLDVFYKIEASKK